MRMKFTPSRDGVERSDVTVEIRMSRELLRQVKQAASHEGVTLKEWLRSALHSGIGGELERVDADLELIKLNAKRKSG